jgi:hypothetical protein
MRLAHHFICVSLGVAALACSSSTTNTTTVVRPELVQVSPEDFLGAQVCGTSRGQVQSYVATLFDVMPLSSGVVPKPGFQLPSSPAISCNFPVTFANVFIDHVYLAEIDGYTQPPEELAPATPGGRIQFVPGDGGPTDQRVPPSWTAECGQYPQSLVVDGGSYVPVGGGPTASDIRADEAGAGGEGGLTGVESYDQITQVPHNCGKGLQPL